MGNLSFFPYNRDRSQPVVNAHGKYISIWFACQQILAPFYLKNKLEYGRNKFTWIPAASSSSRYYSADE